MRRYILFGLLIAIALLSISCQRPAGVSGNTPLPQPAAPEVKATPVPTAAPPKVAVTPVATTAEGQLRQSIAKLNGMGSFKFTLEGDHHLTFESKPRTWHYTGSGAYASPDSWRWSLKGQADVALGFVGVGDEMQCVDTRGIPLRPCSLAWGGPLPGTSPFTLIAYLSSAEKVTASGVRSIDGGECACFTFSPDKSKVGALDQAQAEAMTKVIAVDGEVCADKGSGLPRRETVKIKAISKAGQEESMDVTVNFSDYGQPVDIRLPNKTGG